MSKTLTDHEKHVLDSVTEVVTMSLKIWLQQVIVWLVVIAGSFGLIQKVYNPDLYQQYIGLFRFFDISAIVIQWFTTGLLFLCYSMALIAANALCAKGFKPKTAVFFFNYYGTLKGFHKKQNVPIQWVSYFVMTIYFVALVVANHPYCATAQIGLIWIYNIANTLKVTLRNNLLEYATPEVWGRIQQLKDLGALKSLDAAIEYDKNPLADNVILTRADVNRLWQS